jgi:hypothetical protein
LRYDGKTDETDLRILTDFFLKNPLKFVNPLNPFCHHIAKRRRRHQKYIPPKIPNSTKGKTIFTN